MATVTVDHGPSAGHAISAFSRARVTRRSPTILLAGNLSALDAARGPETQMLGLARALPMIGVTARLWRPWEDSLAEVDCLHLFGSAPEHVHVVEAARRRNVRVVLSPLAGSDPGGRPGESRPLGRRVAAWAERLGRAVYPRRPSWRRHLYHEVDLLLPYSNAEAQQILRHFQVPPERVHIVPYGADPRFANADPEPFARLFGLRHFVLYAGPIEPKNHQLAFLWAMHQSDVPVVMLGDVVPGFEWYLAECRRVAGDRVRFVPHVHHDDPLLASAYAACGCLVLAGGLETPGVAALEAAMSGTPLVLPEGGCAGEYFGQQALYIKPDDLPGIRRAVLTALARGRSKELAQHIRTYFSWNAAARVVREAYQKVLAERREPGDGR